MRCEKEVVHTVGGNNRDDCVVVLWGLTDFAVRDTLSHACMCEHVNSRVWDVYCVHTPSITVDLIYCKRNSTATTKNFKIQLRTLRGM